MNKIDILKPQVQSPGKQAWKKWANWQAPCQEIVNLQGNFLYKEIHKKCWKMLPCWKEIWLILEGYYHFFFFFLPCLLRLCSLCGMAERLSGTFSLFFTNFDT